MKAMSMGLIFLGMFHIFLVLDMAGDTVIIGSFLSGIAILTGVGFWFVADELNQIKRQHRNKQDAPF